MIENCQLLEYVGKTWNDKLKNQISKEYFELKTKKYPNIENNVYPMSIVRVTEPNETEIKSIGMSCIDDILSDNFGRFLAGFISGQTPTVAMTNLVNLQRPITISGSGTPFNSTNIGTVGSQMQVGKGITPATRTDFKIESPFTNGGIEDGRFSTGFGGYNSGLGQITIDATLTPTFGSGTISETVLFALWASTAGAIEAYSLSRDNISPVVNFIIGEAVTVEYLINLS